MVEAFRSERGPRAGGARWSELLIEDGDEVVERPASRVTQLGEHVGLRRRSPPVSVTTRGEKTVGNMRDVVFLHGSRYPVSELTDVRSNMKPVRRTQRRETLHAHPIKRLQRGRDGQVQQDRSPLTAKGRHRAIVLPGGANVRRSFWGKPSPNSSRAWRPSIGSSEGGGVVTPTSPPRHWSTDRGLLLINGELHCWCCESARGRGPEAARSELTEPSAAH